MTDARMNEIARLARLYKITNHDDIFAAIRDLFIEIERLKAIIREMPVSKLP